MRAPYSLALCVCMILSLCVHAQGTLDNTFNGNGKSIADIPDAVDYYSSAAAIQPDGKILVAGNAYGGLTIGGDFVIVRYNSDGSPDNSFGTGGMVFTDINNSEDRGNSILVRPNGSIVVAGVSYVGNDDTFFALVQYNSDGSVDTTFGMGGKVATAIEFHDIDIAAALQSDGKIVVTGQVWSNILYYHIAVARYNTNGSLDSSFGINGILETNVGSSSESVVVQPDGRIIVAGSKGGYFMAVRFLPGGSLDSSFSNDGITSADIAISQSDWGETVVLQADGKVIVGGLAGEDFGIVRFNQDGSPDTTFGNDGKVATPIGSSLDYGLNVAIQQDGKIVMAGYSSDGGDNNDFAVVRYHPNGVLDSAFGGGGIITTSIGPNSDDKAYSVVIQPDGKIVLAGYTADTMGLYDIAVVRYLPEFATGLVDIGSLQQFIYPNPIISNTERLEYALDKSQMVTVSLLNSNGQLLKTFFSQKQQAGKQTESLELPRSLSDGWYAIKIETENGSAIVKVMK